MGKIMLQGYSCDRCGHEWAPRIKIVDDPTICPKCKSPYWNKPRRIDLGKNEVEQARYSMQRKRGKIN